jgi:hypothetical protein
MPPSKLFGFKHDDMKLFVDTNGVLSCSNEYKKPEDSMFWVVEETLNSVCFKCSNPIQY